jgi:SNF2 family DNA or RNA helicase
VTRKLRPYQEASLKFIEAHPTAGLFMDMGLGKTAVVLHAIADFLPKPVLLVGPIRVVETVWRTEALAWPRTQGLTFSLLRGTPKARIAARATPADVYLVNPESLKEVLEDPAMKFATLVIDESSQYKNPSTQRFKLLRKHLDKFSRRIILTGTPTPNSLLDLWSQIFLLDKGARLGRSFYGYRGRYFFQTDYMGYTFAPRQEAEAAVTRVVSDIVLRVEAKGNLPPREVLTNRVIVQLPTEARSLYKRMADDAFALLASSTLTAANAAAALMKLRQIASGFVYDDDGATVAVHTEKIKALQEIVEETGSPIIVVYQFLHELAELRKAFPDAEVFDSDKVDPWNRGEIPLMFLHPKSGGHGVNLQDGGHTMVVYSGSFSQEEMSQTFARIDRQGQQNPVVIHHLIAEDTVDELILEVLFEKTHNQSILLERIKQYALAYR